MVQGSTAYQATVRTFNLLILNYYFLNDNTYFITVKDSVSNEIDGYQEDD